jgi:hypothetical protein
MASLPPSTAALSAFQRAVKEAWNQRSEGEKEAWRADCHSRATPPEAASSERLEVTRARQRGALSGWVEPLDLLHGLTVENQHALLDSIAISFDRSRTSGGWRWQMRAGARASVFRGLVDSNDAIIADLHEAVADAACRPICGEQFRSIIAADGFMFRPQPRRFARRASIDRQGPTEARSRRWAGPGSPRRRRPSRLSRCRRRATPSAVTRHHDLRAAVRLLDLLGYRLDRELAARRIRR